jgi:hypothetical protein
MLRFNDKPSIRKDLREKAVEREQGIHANLHPLSASPQSVKAAAPSRGSSQKTKTRMIDLSPAALLAVRAGWKDIHGYGQPPGQFGWMGFAPTAGCLSPGHFTRQKHHIKAHFRRSLRRFPRLALIPQQWNVSRGRRFLKCQNGGYRSTNAAIVANATCESDNKLIEADLGYESR